MPFVKGQSGNPRGNYASLAAYWLKHQWKRHAKRKARGRRQELAILKLKDLAEQMILQANAILRNGSAQGEQAQESGTQTKENGSW
jgi:hypothetical protein